MTKPTLEDDESALQRYAGELLTKCEAVVGDWIRRSIVTRNAALAEAPATTQAVEAGSREIIGELTALLKRDIAEQAVGPLQILRSGTRFATGVLAEAGTVPVERDDFAVRAFPDDVYGLAPANFGEVDPSLHEAGLVWGAAKAHVHLRRRREAGLLSERRIVALSADLMDRSKIAAAFPDATLVRSVPALLEAAVDAMLVLVDLGRVEDPAVLAEIDASTIAFGSHVDAGSLAAAEAAGAQAWPRSRFFRRLADDPESLVGESGSPAR